MELQQLESEFQAFLQSLTTVEKKTISALTEISRDVLRTRPQGAPVVAAVIINRVLQAPIALKLPTLYLLDSIVKLVGEPYTSLFAPQLPEAFAAAWHAGGANLQKSLQKLYSTWQGVFAQHVLTDVAVRISQLPAAPAAALPSLAASYYQPSVQPLQQQAILMPALQQQQQPSYQYGILQQQQPVMLGVSQGYNGQDRAYTQQPVSLPRFDAPPQQPAFAAAASLPQMTYGQSLQPTLQQATASQPPAAAAVQQQQQQPVDLANLMASLVNSGILAMPPTQGGMAAQPATPPAAASGGDSTPPAAATPEHPEEPVSLEFTPERIKDKNPAAVHRLMQLTEDTKSNFLDRKFLRRQRRTGSQRVSRLWYVDLDMWMASTMGTGATQAAQQQQEAAAAGGEALPEQCSVPVDDSQTHCALSGERFQQFWDEQHQEWRYRDAKQLDAEEAAKYGLEEGALVLVSAMGAPSGDLLQPSGGVLSSMKAEQGVAEDLAAAAAGGVPSADSAAEAVEEGAEMKGDIKPSSPGVKREAAGEEAGLLPPEQKRLRVH